MGVRDHKLETCPKCGRYMNWHMKILNGSPYQYYVCPCCGYNSSANTILYKTSNRTEIDYNPDYMMTNNSITFVIDNIFRLRS